MLGRKPRCASAAGRSALKHVCAILAATTSGRYLALRWSGFTIGRYVGAGEIDRDAAGHALFIAAQNCGCVKKHGARRAVATIDQGLAHGASKPRKTRPRAEAPR